LPAVDFAAYGLADAGCFVLRDVATGFERVSSPVRCAERRRPYSTFKIVTALVGLDLGLLAGPDAMMKGDPARYPKQDWWFAGWDRDQPLREAMALSAVPLFRRLAHDIGPERMGRYLALLDYGNQDVSGGPDRFWLDGALRISALEQAALVTRLVRAELPVSKAAQAALRDVLRREPIAGAAHAGKTGTGVLETEAGDRALQGAMVGWMVGWLELARGSVVYAMWVEAPSSEAVRDLRTRTLEGVLGDVAAHWH
jgi:beta-lactamase class D